MKTPREYISKIEPNDLNFQYIAASGKINGALLIDIEKAMKEYAKQWVEKVINEIADVPLERSDEIERYLKDIDRQ